MPIRHANRRDLDEIVSIYNASIPGRMATADLVPVTVEGRREWFAAFDPARRPIWVYCDDERGGVAAWVSLRSFYGRAAYEETVEVAVYTAPSSQRKGFASRLLGHALGEAPALGITAVLAFVFAHNEPSIRLFTSARFEPWGRLPGVARLDGVRRDLLVLGRPL